MASKPYPGMGNVSKSEGLYLQKKKREKRIFVSIPEGFAQIPISFLTKDPEVIDNDGYDPHF